MNEKILIVEDEPIPAEDIKEILEIEGYVVMDIVNNGLDAIDRASNQKPEIVIMDINLEGSMTGTEAAVVIQSYFKIPIIFLTAYADKETLNEAKKANPYGYIIKPYEDNDIITSVELALSKKKSEKENTKKQQKELAEVKAQLQSAQAKIENQQKDKYRSIKNDKLTSNLINQKDTKANQKDNELFLMDILEEISNYDRFLILDSLRLQKRSILELEIILQKAQPTLYHHIRRLEQKGLIKGVKTRKNTPYALVEGTVQKFLSVWKDWTLQFSTWFGVE